MKASLKALLRQPAFGVPALLTLMLGIGAPTATFSVLHAVLLRPLPFHEPDRIVRFRMEGETPNGRVAFDAVPAAVALQWGADATTLSALSVFNDRSLTFASEQGPFRLSGVAASPNLFEVLGSAPALGRTFDPSTTDTRQVVLSYATWQRFFAANPAVVGSMVSFDGVAHRVAAVMPPSFHFPAPETAFWVPMVVDSSGTRGMVLPAVARLQPEASLASVLGEGRTRLADAGGRRELTLYVDTLHDQLVGPVRRRLWVLMGAVAFVSAIATANMALLLLVRGASRERELSIRLALGAGRGQLARQLVGEGFVLALIGGGLGVILAGGLLAVLPGLAPRDLVRLTDAGLNGPVLAFAVALTAITSLVFCVLSAGRTLAIDPFRSLSGSAGESRLIGWHTPRRRLRVLAASELAMTTVLLIGAALLMLSFVRELMVDQGFDPRGALAMQITLPASRYPTADARLAFHERLLERLRSVEGLDATGLTTAMPNRQPTGRFDYGTTPPQGPPDPATLKIAEVRMVSAGFTEAMGLRLRAGRAFAESDREGAEQVMIISDRLARLHFGDANPIGQILYSRSGNGRVVGVVADVRPAALFAPTTGAAYVPLRQQSGVLDFQAGVTVVARGRNVAALAAPLRAAVLGLDPEMTPFNVRTLDEEVAGLTAGARFSASVLAVFAAVALVLASIGVYGVIAYLAGQRTAEIAIRLAIGATRGQVVRVIMRDGVLVILAGLSVGTLASLALAQTLAGLLYQVQPADPRAIAGVVAVLALVALAAAYLPARRAARAGVLSSLRAE